MSIKFLYLPENFYTSPKQIYGYAPADAITDDATDTLKTLQ